MFVPQKLPFLKIADDVIACDLWSVTIGGKKFWVFNYKFMPLFIFVYEVIAHPVCAHTIMSIRRGGI